MHSGMYSGSAIVGTASWYLCWVWDESPLILKVRVAGLWGVEVGQTLLSNANARTMTANVIKETFIMSLVHKKATARKVRTAPMKTEMSVHGILFAGFQTTSCDYAECM